MSESELPSREGEFKYRGHTLDELQEMSLDEFTEIAPARMRRTLERGLSEEHEKLLDRVEDGDDEIRTHLRDMPILPEMVGTTFMLHNGQEFERVDVEAEMVGHYLGEFELTRKDVEHGQAGIGATRSSKFVPLK
ncbi:MAG: 30S ribosomal protein S19 [Halobacteriales archaeon]|nr:30S ribosomal protein S19 [Halobacteriales archaeon]